MMEKEIIEELNAMTNIGDTERDHRIADDLLLVALKSYGADDIVNAYIQARDRCGFCYA